jgi:diphthine-ammonia ligase
MKLIAAWSGGKDSCFALYKALKQGHCIQSLLTMMQDINNSNFHMISSELLDAQSEALGIPINKVSTTPETYELQFGKALREAKNNGAQGILTGDIYEIAQHEPGWIERVSANAGLTATRPLWHRDTRQVLDEFINNGFKATIVRVNRAALGIEYLGRQLDRQLYAEIQEIGSVDPCGEKGEYHTFVTDGPIFSKEIEILKTKTSQTQSWGRLEIISFALKSKKEG